jgi:hypothetical protein
VQQRRRNNSETASEMPGRACNDIAKAAGTMHRGGGRQFSSCFKSRRPERPDQLELRPAAACLSAMSPMATSLPFKVESPLQEDALDRLIERAGVGATVDQRAHRLVHGVARFFRRLAGACDIRWHGVRRELATVLPNADGVVSPHCFRAIITSRRFAARQGSGVSGHE